MNEVLDQVLAYINLYMLILARCIGLFIASPIFGRSNLPNIFKLGFCMILSYILLPYIHIENISTMSFIELLFFAMKEVIIGVIIGFIGFIIFSTFFLAGSFIDMELGFGMAGVMDPQYGTQVPLTGNLIYILSTLIFLILNGHHYLIKALVNSFNLLPIKSFLNIDGNFLKFLARLFEFIFVSAAKIAIPVMIGIFLTNLILGILARTMPQMNVFVVGMPLKILFGLAIISFVLPYYVPIIKNMFKEMYEFIFKSIKLFQG